MIPRRPISVVTFTAYTALLVGSVAGLSWLAPLEYGTGRWLGLGQVLAAAVPALIDSYVVLSVMTSRDRAWSLPIAGLSGGVGQLHAAGILPETDVRVRAWVAALAVVIAVAVTARLKPLVQVVVAEVRSEREAAEASAVAARETAERAAREAVAAAEREAHERAMEASREAHQRDLDLASLEAAREATVRRPVRPKVPPKRTPSRTPHSGGDLQRRKAAEAGFKASVRAGEAWSSARLAAELYGVSEPDAKQRAAASARATEWRRAVEREASAEVAQ